MQNHDDRPHGVIVGALAEATGRDKRDDPILPRTGGPAGNAVLTAWTGLVLLILSIAELLTLFNVRGLLSWHVAIGALLVPPALMKTTTTGWRMVRYYAGNEPYQKAGPPPTLMRLLGPLVVLSTLGLLASGVVLVLIGESRSHNNLGSVLGFGLSWISIHQGAFIVWATATGLHLLGRIVPAIRIAFASRVGRIPGASSRVAAVSLVAVVAVVLAFVLVHADGSWTIREAFRHRFGSD
ncbi:MAG: hypothetical protein JWR35_467 [Marmoricola sp.]|jgi:hypothetical protein|nr:hypothetical protein [Marmoricola sp.]